MGTTLWSFRKLRHFWKLQRSHLIAAFVLFGLYGCGQTAPPVVSPANGKVNSYFGGPFVVSGSTVTRSASAFDHSANSLAVSGLITSTLASAQVPVNLVSGTFTSAPTGFLGITETLATVSNTGAPTPLNPSVAGAWAVEIPGAGALSNLLSINTSNTPATISAAPVAMATNSSCPNFPAAAPFLYVTVPNTSQSVDQADYGTAEITTQGSAVTFSVQPYLLGSPASALSPSVVTGGCSQTILGALTSFPLNSFGSSSNLELISIGASGLLVSTYESVGNAPPGAFGGGKGVIGVATAGSAVDVGAIAAAQYNGFIFSPQNGAKQASYDITVLASSFGNHAANSPACSVLQASLLANNSQAGTVPVLPSVNSLYGGEFLVTSGSGQLVNDPTGDSGSENCDMVIDLGAQDPSNNGLFPEATIFVGSNFPPFSDSNPWSCGAGPCAVSFPAAAIVGQIQGKFVILISASSSTNPPAQLPGSTQPLGIYLFQK